MRRLFAIALLVLNCVTAHSESAQIGAFTIQVPTKFKAEAKHELDSLGDMEITRWRAEGHVIEVGGQKTELIETNVFFGTTKKVLAVYLHVDESTYAIDSEKIPIEEFKEILQTATISISSNADVQLFVGKSLADLFNAKGLTLAQCKFIDEPPGVLSQLSCLGTDERSLEIFLKRHSSQLFSEKMQWSHDTILEAKIAKVEYGEK
jgi:hypothetical protein